MVATVGKRLFLLEARAAGWLCCMGEDGGFTRLSALGASSCLPRQKDARPELGPPPSPAAPVFGIWRRPHLARQSWGPATLGPAAIPRPHGGGERSWQSSASGSAPPVKRAEGSRFTQSLPKWGLGEHAVIAQNPALCERRSCGAAGTV